MAAYAALVSLTHVIDQIQNHHHLQISLHKELAESLTKNITFLQDFLEAYNSHSGSKADSLQSRIADAAYAAEDIIESHVVDQILAGDGEKGSSFCNQGLQKVIVDIDFITKEVMKTMETSKLEDLQKESKSFTPAHLAPRAPTMKNAMVGFDDHLNRIMDKLTGQSKREIIPVIGMGGIGKTTLARNVYDHTFVVQHFDNRAWVTISQAYNVKEIFLGLLYEIGAFPSDQTEEENSDNSVACTTKMDHMSEYQLGEQLYKSLVGRRYLIVLDDMWCIEVWDKVRFFFPDSNCESRIIVTTRLSNVASCFGSFEPYKMNFLNEDRSWDLLCEKVFGQEGCPLELERKGKEIAKNCKGLPLSIVVIGGLLTKSERTLEHWERVAEDVNTIVNLEDDERCLKILSMSYRHLPMHLKPCFLYMGVFPKDHEIHCSKLIKQWVAEGFLKPISTKSMEETAEDYLVDLIDRNLILVRKWGSTGKIKSCNIHDLLRELCVKETQKDNFLHIASFYGLDFPLGERRICINGSRLVETHHQPQAVHSLQLAPLARSLICNFKCDFSLRDSRLLRVLDVVNKYVPEVLFQLVNSRYLLFDVDELLSSYKFPSSISLLWNLQTIIIEKARVRIIAPSEIWKMRQLRHVKIDMVFLPDPPDESKENGQCDVVLADLQTLKTVENFKCSEEVLKRIPNIKKLKIFYEDFCGREGGSYYDLKNLINFHKLESLTCFFIRYLRNQSYLPRNLSFPHSLKKLTLRGSRLLWSHMTMIGSLPHLEVLKLNFESFIGSVWIPVVGQFLHLKFLLIYHCLDLEHWPADRPHFPQLEQLVLHNVPNLEEIPLGIGDIPTLQSIKLEYCSNHAIVSAKRILEEQESMGNESLRVQVLCKWKTKDVEDLASGNFQVHVLGGAQASVDFKGMF